MSAPHPFLPFRLGCHFALSRNRPLDRWLMALRVQDALIAGASQREIAIALFGAERIPVDWRSASDSLRSRVRRLVREARILAGGRYRGLLGRHGPEKE
ncbi:DNA -binding domain-containing protein [Sphingobium yanoikuyae]|uniref:DUF2285 domain-containing protein n=2 Tax=Sphingobium yanoikuyae TaxID=13690 RepID=A0A9X7UG90_SPHYA|nr:DUF2285 domain-containing protein [Sphingobium yanoikuyae]QNG49728.1 DUF2285 domain-containing protein [Sphingobium yanoikuyae]